MASYLTNKNEYQVGFDNQYKYDEIQADIDRRFNIFNLSVSTQFKAQEMLNRQYTKQLTEYKEEVNYLKWYIGISWYKKLWWKLTNKNFIDIWKSIN